MFDTHYDLLTKLYICYKRNDFSYIENWIKNYNLENVTGLIANLCFMSPKEMEEEYDVNYFKEGDSVIEVFRISTDLLRKYVPSNIKVYASIEGCDYLNDENDLVTLKELGLDAIVPVWNCKSKFGSGNRSEDGLTPLGERLIDKAVELNLGIDLSHANEKTFWDIINYIKSNNLDAKVYASHSNSKSLCDVSRNLTDDQIKALGDLGGFVGVMSNSGFVDYKGYSKREEILGTPEYNEYIDFLKQKYVEHINHIIEITGNIESVCLSTDDMGFCELDDYKESPIFDYRSIGKGTRELLSNYYSEEEVNKIMYENAINYMNRSFDTTLKMSK